MGDKLMLHIPERPGTSRRGVPLEKVRFSLKRVPADFIESTVIPRMLRAVVEQKGLGEKIANRYFSNGEQMDIIKFQEALKMVAPAMIASFRKSARLVVAKAVSSGRPDHQIDVKLTAPSFI